MSQHRIPSKIAAMGFRKTDTGSLAAEEKKRSDSMSETKKEVTIKDEKARSDSISESKEDLDESILKKVAQDSGGSLHRRRKVGSKMGLEKVNKNFESMNKSNSINEKSNSMDFSDKDKGRSGSISAAVGKNALKKLGFQMSKSSAINFYDKWKFDEYPTVVCHVFDTFTKSVGVGNVVYGKDEDDWIGNFMQVFHDKMEENSKKTSGLIPRNYRKLMTNMWEECQKLLEQQKKLDDVVRIQSLIRGYQARKEVRLWIAEEKIAYTKTKRHMSNLAFRELLKSESEYIRSLNFIVEQYLWPLKNSSVEGKRTSGFDLSQLVGQDKTGMPNLSKEDIEAMFANVEELHNTHQRILRKLKSLREKWPFLDNVGATFLKIVPQLIVYGDYVANSKHSMDTLARLQDQDAKFRNFCTEQAAKECGELMGLLVRPLNHISNYTIYLKIVKNNTPSDDPDMENIRNAYLALKKTKLFIQEYYQQAGNRAKIAEIQRKLQTTKGQPYEVAGNKRVFMKEGPMGVMEKTLGISNEKSRVYYLFNDLLLVVEDNQKTLKLHYDYPLKDTVLEDIHAAKDGFQFILNFNNVKTTFSMKTQLEKNEFLKVLKSNIEQLNIANRTFGVPLIKLLEREKPADGIPFVVKSCVEFLKKKRETEGIFRISGGTAEVAALKDLFTKLETVPKEPLNLSSHNAYAVAAILKMFFRELPEPIFTFAAFKPLASVQFEEKEPSAYSNNIKQIISTLPPANLILIRYIFSFLLSVAKYGSVNKMTTSNLAIVFGPNLLFPQEESLETIMLIPKMNSLFLFMFDHYTDIFGEKVPM